MNDNEAAVRITANASGVAPGVAQAKGEIGSLEPMLAQLNASMESLGASIRASLSPGAKAAAEMSAAMHHLEEETERESLSLKEIAVSVHEAVEGLNGMKFMLAEIAEVWMAAFAIEKIADWAKEFAEAREHVEHLAQTFGMTTNQVQEMGAIATTTGISLDAITRGMQVMDRNAIQAADGNSAVANAFKAVGVSANDGMSQMQRFYTVADKFKGMEDGPKKAALAMELFGRSGTQLIPILNLGADGLKEMAERAKEFDVANTAVSASAQEKGVALAESINETKLAWQGVTNVLGDAFAPMLKEVTDSINLLIKGFIDSYNEGGVVATVFEAIKNVVGEAGAVIDALAGIFGALWEAVSEIVTDIAGAIADLFGAKLPSNVKVGETFLNLFKDTFVVVKDVIIVAIEVIKGALVFLIDEVRLFAGQAKDALTINWGAIDFSEPDSTNPGTYTWSLIKGTDGVNGAPGAVGPSGQTLYTWIAFADAPDGSINFTTGTPGTRAYIGLAAGQATPTPGANAAAYIWAPYTGPAGFGLVASANGGGSASIAGNKVLRGPGPPYDWGYAGGYSAQGFSNGAQATFRGFMAAPSYGQPGPYFMAGLNTDPTTDNSYTSIDYAFFVHDSDGVRTHSIYESGQGIIDCGIWDPYTTACQIVYDGRYVTYYLNGQQQRRTPAPANLSLWFDSSIVRPYTGLIIDGFGATGTAGADGAQGIPGPPAADGSAAFVHIAYANSADGSQDFVTGAANPGRTYIGIYTDGLSAGSSDYHAYNWSRLTGQNGTNGTNGTPGPVGADGRQSYVHFAYANSIDGTADFTTGAPGSRGFIGVYSDYTLADSSSPSSYRWSLIRGADGSPGPQGNIGSTGATGGTGPAGASGSNGVDGLSALNIRTVGTVTWDGHNLVCGASAGDYTSNGAYSGNVIAGGVAITFQRPDLFDNEEGRLGLASSPTSSLSQSAVEFGWNMYRAGSSHGAQVVHGSDVLYSEDWNGSYTYSTRYDNNTGVVTWYRNDSAVATYATGAGRSFGIQAVASRSMAVANLAFTAAGGTGATGNAGPPRNTGAKGDTGQPGPPGQNGTNGSNGVSPSPAYTAMPISVGTFTYSGVVPLNNGQSLHVEAQLGIRTQSADQQSCSIQIQYSLDSGSSWNVRGSDSGSFDSSDPAGLSADGNYTNNTGGKIVASLRTVATCSGSYKTATGYMQPS